MLSHLLGHVLAPTGAAGIAQWISVALVLLGGLLLLVPGRRGNVERMGWAGLIAGGVAIIVIEFVFAPPVAPGYSLSIVEPPSAAHVTSPLRLVACGRLASGGPAEVPGPGRALSVFLDGRQVGSTTRSELVVVAEQGSHKLRAEILTGDHREYQPPVAVEETVVVTGPGSMREARPCPRN